MPDQPLRARTVLAAWMAAAAVYAVAAQSPSDFRAEYTVEVKDPATQLFHVTATFSNLHQPQLDLALPIWTPGWYTLEYYAKNIFGLSATDGQGTRLPAPLSRVQTWSIDTKGLTRVVVQFDYRATVLALNQAKITGTYAFFTGSQLFLEPVGHRDAAPTVRFVVPSGWGIVSALADTADPSVYTARNYDELVDAPTWLGAFALHRFVVDGKPHLVVFDAALRFPDEEMQRYLDSLATMVRTAGAIFGGLPYDKYVFFKLPDVAESSADGALEHANSYVGCCGGPTRLTVGRYVAHEFFHLWNAKRIRPAEFWPYDYSQPTETPSLWMSEGVTDYYGLMIAYRAGFISEAQVLAALSSTIRLVERNPARTYLSPSDASMGTWRAYLREPVSYYNAGAVLGALLDLSILHDTSGRRGLDDVMRLLFSQFYERTRGFTAVDLERTVGSVAGRDYSEFFQRFVKGVESPPYESILGYAGVRKVSELVFGVLGARLTLTPEGRRIDQIDAPPAAWAGLRQGDVVTAVDGRPVGQVVFGLNGCCILGKAGQTVVLTVQRGSAQSQVSVALDREYREASFDFDPNASPGQLAVRRAWLARK